MSLVTDARVCSNHANLAKDKIKFEVLSELEKDLASYEKISILFLITSADHLTQSYQKIMEFFEINKVNMLQKWIQHFEIQNWEEKFLETLLIIKNFEIIKKLRFSKEEQLLFQKRYQTSQIQVSPNLNRVLKTLYFLSDDLNSEETKALINKLPETDGVERDQLELFILSWIKKGFISISGETGNLNNLLSALREIKYSKDNPIYVALEYLNYQDDIKRNVQDAQQSLGNSLTMVMEDTIRSTENNEIITIMDNMTYEWERGLCVIINQEVFFPKKYKKRFGSQTDVDKLKSTFTNCGFSIEVEQNLSEAQFLKVLEKLGNYTKKEYDCIMLCILSHGKEKSFVTSDCKDVSLETVENGMCTLQLKGVVKIVIIQACQGDYLGRLVYDGISDKDNVSTGELRFDRPSRERDPSKFDNIRYTDFVMFLATIGKYQSVRNEKEGSWFIQTLCDVLERHDKIYWHDFVLKVKNLVAEKRGTVNNVTNVVQVAETTNDRLKKRFLFRKKKVQIV